jgi:hypothetical protein
MVPLPQGEQPGKEGQERRLRRQRRMELCRQVGGGEGSLKAKMLQVDLNSIPLESSDLDEKVRDAYLCTGEDTNFLRIWVRLMLHPSVFGVFILMGVLLPVVFYGYNPHHVNVYPDPSFPCSAESHQNTTGCESATTGLNNLQGSLLSLYGVRPRPSTAPL